ncbi:hypothetical protein KBD45_06185 [Candidatus Dojkabacteria bacterium]|nr:hypothetical protein [Candidatus Dojkabacteria bacterium]
MNNNFLYSNNLNKILNQLVNMCGGDKLRCFVSEITMISIILVLISFIFIFLAKVFLNIISDVKQFTETYGEDKLYLRTIKRIGDLNFIKVLYFEYVQQKIVNPLKQIYYPSVVSLIATILFSFVTFHLLGANVSNDVFIKYLESNYYQNFIAIHAGIGAIILAFLILVAETSDSGNNHNKARLILKETWLFPLATLEILSLLLFAIGNKSFGSIVSIFVIGFLTIRAIYKVTELFINRYLLQEKERDLVYDRFSAKLDQAVKERIATNTLLEYFEKSEFAIDYSYYRPSKENIKAISLSKKGILKDIHLGKLEKLLSEIEKEANRIDRTIKKNPQAEKKAGRITNTITSKDGKTLTPVQVSILKIIGGQIVDDSKEIISIPKSLFEVEEIRKRIQKSVDSIFIIETEDTAEKEIRLELDEMKDKAFSAIEDSKVGILSSVMDTYVGLVGQFLNVFESYGGGYTSEAARKERNSLVGGWPYIKWIREDMRDVISETIRSEKEKLVTEVTYAPMKILYKAFIKKDHLIFQEFMSFQPYFYWEAKNVKDENIKKFLIDRSTRYFKEFMEYRVTPDLEDQDLTPEGISHIKDFVYEILQSYSNLLKYAFDEMDNKSFARFLSDVRSLLHRFEPTKEYRKVEIELQLKAQNITNLEKEELENKLKLYDLLEETEINIKQKKLEMIFGLSAWCLHKLKYSNFEDQSLIDMWNSLFPYLPNNLEELFKIYESSYRFNTQGFWGWDWWELEKRHEDTEGIITGEMKYDEYVHTLFALLLLKILKGKTLTQVDTSSIAISRDSSFFFDKDDAIAKTKLNEIANNQNQWQEVVSLDEVKAKDTAIAVLKGLVDRFEREEKIQLINTQIDPIKVKEFIDNFVDAYEKEISLRRILDMNKAVFNIAKLSKNKNYWGFNEIQRKEPFISFGHVDYGGYGEHYGQGLGNSEDQIIFGQIRSNSTIIKDGRSLSESIKIAIKQLGDTEFKPKVIFTTFHLGEWRRATLDKAEFIPSWEVKGVGFSNVPNFIGLYKFGRRKIPIYRIWVNESKNEVSEVIVTDINKFIKLEQYPPFLKEAERAEMEVKGNLAFKITDLSADTNKATRDKLISDNPSWLQNETNKDDYLKQKVIVHVKEKFEIKVLDKRASIKITIDQVV